MNDAYKELDENELSALRTRAKAEIRRQLRAVRRVLPIEACSERGARVCESVAQLPEWQSAKVVIAYVAMRKELDPNPLFAAARTLGRKIGLPRIDGDVLVLHEYAENDELEESGYGTFDPSVNAPRIAEADVDLVIVPGLAFDPRGHRVGYGRGYYDRLLPTLPRAFKVGVAYDFQLIAEAPNDAHDVALDCVVTDVRVMRANE
jgi:5-formyltetrahydrofolate cyclo-ligase